MHQPNPDTHVWMALYQDGSAFWEVDEQGGQHGFAEVDQTHLVSVSWVPAVEGGAEITVDIDPSKHERPILFRRRRIKVNGDTGATLGRYTIHYIGVERRLNGQKDGQKAATMVRIYPGGSIRVTDHANDDDTED